MPAKMRTMGRDCTCDDACLVFRDQFDRAPEFFNGLDSTSHWEGSPDVDPDYCWHITLDASSYKYLEVSKLHAPTGPWRCRLQDVVPRHFTASVRFLASAQCVHNITYQAITASDPSADRRFKLQITTSDQRYSEDDGSHCGSIRLWDVTDLLSPVPLTAAHPVPGLIGMGTSPGVMSRHTATLCYDPETQVLRASVKTVYGETFWVHYKQAVTAPDTLLVSQLWLEVEDFGPYPVVGHPSGFVSYNDFRLSQGRNPATSYYYYGDGEVEDCPCCSDGCGSETIDMSGTAEDCRWLASSGTLTYPGDGTASVTGSHTWFSSWSGVDDDCLPDPSMRIAAQVSASTAGAVAKLRVNHSPDWYEGRLTFESSPGADDGTVELVDSAGSVLASASVSGASVTGPTWVDMAVCFDGYAVTFNCLGEQLEAESSGALGAFCGVGSSGGTVSFRSVSVSHNVYSADCPNCFDGPDGGMTTGCEPCFPEVPLALKLRFSGPVCATIDDVEFGINGTYLVPLDTGEPSCGPVVIGRCPPRPGDHSAYDDLTLDPSATYTVQLPGLGGTFGDNYEGTITDAACNEGYDVVGSLVIPIIYIGVDGDGTVWVYLLMRFGLGTFPGTVPEVSVTFRKSLGPCPVDLATALEYLELDYDDSCMIDCETNPEGQFCRWSEFHVSVRR